ncbi:hypothetical protein BC827DRAFT_903817 [Russula dissimulans]|nr:hypothetical protein BC827DRAFT_903817 [Russula dissimulans]
MVNSNDSIGTATVSRAYATLALAVDGLYVWEFFINLGYEWSVIKGRRPYRWTIWIYSTVRLTTLMGVIIEFVTSIMAAPTNCKVWTIFQFGSGYMTFSLSSLLIILRIIAIWNKNKFVVAFAVAVWLTTASFFIYGITHLHSEWDPNELGCGNPQTESNKLAITAMPITDIALLLIMLIGLLRIGLRGGGKFSVGRLLWKQTLSTTTIS